MKEKIESRVCVICGVRKRTTVRKAEQDKYICNPCMRKKGYVLFFQDKLELPKALSFTAILIIIGIIIGYIIGKM